MNAKDIQSLIDFIAQSGLAEVNIKTKEIELSVRKHPKQNVKVVEQAAASVVAAPAAPAVAAAPEAPASTEAPAAPAAAADESNYVPVKSPMIGTFYRASNPDTPAFVQVGDKVEKGQIVCIVEAMKLFNEIESEVSGTIVKVLADNATPVEYDQPLFLVDPA
jgi:acetyl-CoA carboxylase biotin carboxyl carrier protein